MTSNQIAYQELLERKRSNRANEEINIGKLNEEIRNNKAVNKINVTKNDIQALYNNQLDERERRKQFDSIVLEYDKLNETAFSNDLKKDIEKARLELDRVIASQKNDTTLGSGALNALGRVAAAIAKGLLASYGYNSSSNIPGEMTIYDFMSYNNIINGRGTNNDYKLLDMYGSDLGQSGDTSDRLEGIKGITNKWNNSNAKSYIDDNYNSVNQRRNVTSVPKNTQSSGTNRVERYYYDVNRFNREANINEIPVDVTQSYGPNSTKANNSNSTPWLSVPNGTNGSRLNTNENPVSNGEKQYSVHGTTSGGTNYSVPGGLTSQGIIYA